MENHYPTLISISSNQQIVMPTKSPFYMKLKMYVCIPRGYYMQIRGIVKNYPNYSVRAPERYFYFAHNGPFDVYFEFSGQSLPKVDTINKDCLKVQNNRLLLYAHTHFKLLKEFRFIVFVWPVRVIILLLSMIYQTIKHL